MDERSLRYASRAVLQDVRFKCVLCSWPHLRLEISVAVLLSNFPCFSGLNLSLNSFELASRFGYVKLVCSKSTSWIMTS